MQVQLEHIMKTQRNYLQPKWLRYLENFNYGSANV